MEGTDVVELDITQSHVIHQWKYDSPLLACRIAPDGTHAISSAQDFSLQRWNIPSGEKIVLQGHESWVHALVYSVDGQTLISGGCDGNLIWWSIGAPEPQIIRKLAAHPSWIRAIDRSADGQRLVSVGNDRVIRLWNIQTGEKISEWPAHERHIYSALFHHDNEHLITGDLLGKILVWKLSDGTQVKQFDGATLYTPNKGQNAEFGGIRTMALAPNGAELMAAGTHKGTNPFGAVHEPLALRFGWTDGALLRSHVCDGIPGGLVHRVQWIDAATVVGVSGGSSGGILLFFNGTQDKEIHRFGLPSLARDMDLHLPSSLVATAHYDQHLRITGLFKKG